MFVYIQLTKYIYLFAYIYIYSNWTVKIYACTFCRYWSISTDIYICWYYIKCTCVTVCVCKLSRPHFATPCVPWSKWDASNFLCPKKNHAWPRAAFVALQFSSTNQTKGSGCASRHTELHIRKPEFMLNCHAVNPFLCIMPRKDGSIFQNHSKCIYSVGWI